MKEVCLNCKYSKTLAPEVSPGGTFVVQFHGCTNIKSYRHGDYCCSTMWLNGKPNDTREFQTCDYFADKEATDLLDLLIEYWKLTEGCDCTALMTNREETRYLQIKDKLEMEDI